MRSLTTWKHTIEEFLLELLLSVFGNHAVFGGETKRCFLDGDEMVHIQNFRFRNVFFLVIYLINAFVRGLEGGSSKDVF